MSVSGSDILKGRSFVCWQQSRDASCEASEF